MTRPASRSSHEDVTVTEYFGEGALIDRRGAPCIPTPRSLGERLPGGPSRTINANYAGTRRYLPDATQQASLGVKTEASLRISNHHVREGHRVAFKGRIGHLAARIPAGGKLVELEVKDGHSWHTVRHPFYTEGERQVSPPVPLRSLLCIERSLQISRQSYP